MTKQEYYKLNCLYQEEGQTVIDRIQFETSKKEYVDIIAISYILLMADDCKINTESFSSFCESVNPDETRKEFLRHYTYDIWAEIFKLMYHFNANILKSIILFYENFDKNYIKTPDSISRLAYKLFNFADGDEIADFGIGVGTFVDEAYLENPTLKLSGIEINADYKEIAAIRFEIMGCCGTLTHGNILDIDSNSNKYQNIFSNYTLGLIPGKLEIKNYPAALGYGDVPDINLDSYKNISPNYSKFGSDATDIKFDINHMLNQFAKKGINLTKNVSCDWLFNFSILQSLKENGKAIAIMSSRGTWNSLDESARKYFIDNGCLEAVISLPGNMFENMYAPTTMIIISKNNENTMFVDATEMCKKCRRFNILTDENINQIAFAVSNQTPKSVCIPKNEIINNDYVITPIRYLSKNIVVENGVPFDSIIKSINRGTPLGANELDKMASPKPTDYQYLSLSNVQHGLIDTNLQYLNGINEKQKKYCVKNHSLVMSKNFGVCRIAVAELQPGKSILASGNFYVIEIDEDKADPYFVKAFLESKKGTALLKSSTIGGIIPAVSIKALKKIHIPLIPLEEQHKLAKKYLAKVDEIKTYQHKLQKAYEELDNIYDNEVGVNDGYSRN